jgi:Protein of unknown function (DUF1524)
VHDENAPLAALLLLLCPLPTAHADADALAGITVTPQHYRYDYRRAAFGEAWDNGGPCDTRDEILNRDLTEVTHVSTKRCPDAVATGVLDDPYIGSVISFQRGAKTGEAVQIDHDVPLAYAWDMGAYAWTDAKPQRFANDPDELLAVQGKANDDKGDLPPGRWMPPNRAFDCRYATIWITVSRKYSLTVDPASAEVLRRAEGTCR